MRIASELVWCLAFLVGCAANLNGELRSHPDTGRDFYHSPGGEFAAAVPYAKRSNTGLWGAKYSYLDVIEVSDPPLVGVVFTSGAGYWAFAGEHTVDWIDGYMLMEGRAERPFDDVAVEALNNLAKSCDLKGGYTQLTSGEVEVNGRRAYQLVATGTRDGRDAIWFATMIDLGEDAVFYACTRPVSAEAHDIGDYRQDPAWEKYVEYLESLSVGDSSRSADVGTP